MRLKILFVSGAFFALGALSAVAQTPAATAPKAAVAAPKYIGFVDACSDKAISGWAMKDGKATSVTLKVNNAVVKIAPTVNRPDAVKLTGGEAKSGFTYTYKKELTPGTRVEVVFPDGTALTNAPCTTENVFVGYIDRCSQSAVEGWGTHNRKLTPIELFVDGQPVAKVTATVDRADVAKLGAGPLKSGFRHVFASPLPMNATVEAKFSNGEQLSSSPCKVTTK